MLTLYGGRSAFNVQKVLWLLGELALEYEHVLVGGAAGGLDEPELLALNPHGRIPVLRDGDVTVWESHTVLRYLAARHGEGSLWVADPAVRSHSRSYAAGWLSEEGSLRSSQSRKMAPIALPAVLSTRSSSDE